MIRPTASKARWIAIAMALCSCAALAQPAARPAAAAGTLLGPTWVGTWQPAQAVPGAALPAEAITISHQQGVTRMQADAATCDLRYDGQVTQPGVIAHIRQLRDWQLRAEHWPAGTDPASLLGLRQEFHDAEQLLQTVTPDSYRRVRARGPGCDSPDDVFWILHEGQRLLQLRFLAAGLGVEVVLFTRKP